MAQWILQANKNVVPCHTLQPLNVPELHTPKENKKREIFDAMIKRRGGTFINPPTFIEAEVKQELYEDDKEEPRTISKIEDIVDNNGFLINQPPLYKKLINY